jgi:hypothetical protein
MRTTPPTAKKSDNPASDLRVNVNKPLDFDLPRCTRQQNAFNRALTFPLSIVIIVSLSPRPKNGVLPLVRH